MHFRKQLTALSLAFLVFSSSSFATTTTLSLSDARTLAIDNSPEVRNVLLSESSTKDQIRNNIQNSYAIAYQLDQFYDYIHFYEANIVKGSSDNKFKKYIGRSDKYLDTTIGSVKMLSNGTYTGTGLSWDSFQADLANNKSQSALINEEIWFITMYKMFGDNPSLEKSDKYNKFKKNEETLKSSEEYILNKYNFGLEFAKKSVDSGVIQLFIGYADAKEGLTIKQDLLATKKEILVDMSTSLEQGVTAKKAFDDYLLDLEKEELATKNLELTVLNLELQLKKLCGLDMDTNIKLDEQLIDQDFQLSSNPSEYYEKALTNNYDYAKLKNEYDYKFKQLETFNKYYDAIDKDTNRVIYYKEKDDLQKELNNLKDNMRQTELAIKSNVNYAYNDLLLQKISIEKEKENLEYAQKSLNVSVQQYKLGQLSLNQLSQLKLAYYGTDNTYRSNLRKYYSSIERFKLLSDFGVTYQ